MDDSFGNPPGRVAVASGSGTEVDECFGRAVNYYIYEAGPDGYRLIGTRPGLRPCRFRRHDVMAMDGAVSRLSDCDLVLARRIGPEALRQLSEKGVKGLAVEIGIEKALARLVKRERGGLGMDESGT
jgi:nitrogen fixation protein NifB